MLTDHSRYAKYVNEHNKGVKRLTKTTMNLSKVLADIKTSLIGNAKWL